MNCDTARFRNKSVDIYQRRCSIQAETNRRKIKRQPQKYSGRTLFEQTLWLVRDGKRPATRFSVCHRVGPCTIYTFVANKTTKTAGQKFGSQAALHLTFATCLCWCFTNFRSFLSSPTASPRLPTVSTAVYLWRRPRARSAAPAPSDTPAPSSARFCPIRSEPET